MTSAGLEEAIPAWFEGLGFSGRSVEAAIILGSGLDGAMGAVKSELEVDYGVIPFFGRGGAPGHRSVLRLGTLNGHTVALFRGRRHFYETGSMSDAAMPVRISALLGARLLVSMSAVGGIDPALGVGSWAYVTDHINLMGVNPLLGVTGESGPPFVDLTRLYRRDLFDSVKRAVPCAKMGESVLAAFSGPTYETPAEVEMARRMGAGVVGMSTVPEAVWAKYLGLDVAAWGRVANPAAGLGETALDHGDILAEAEKASGEAGQILEATLAAWLETRTD